MSEDRRISYNEAIRFTARLDSLPADLIHSLVDSVNDAEVMGHPGGTLLFVGAQAKPFMDEEGKADLAVELSIIKRVIDWNTFYAPDGSGPKPVTLASTGERLYPYKDWGPLLALADWKPVPPESAVHA